MAATTSALKPCTLAPDSDRESGVVPLTQSDAEPCQRDAAADLAGQPGSGPAASPVDWTELVSRIQQGEESGMEDLYRVFARGIRYYLCRQLGPQELDDKVHDTFLIVVQAIQRGDLREPERLMGFIRTVVRRQVAAHIDRAVHSRREELHLDVGVRVADRRSNPEQSAASHQKIEFMRSILRKLSERDREVLTRFYLDEQSQEQICKEMDLTETQFRLLKSRAKARFGELGKRKLQQKPLVAFSMRNSLEPVLSDDCGPARPLQVDAMQRARSFEEVHVRNASPDQHISEARADPGLE